MEFNARLADENAGETGEKSFNTVVTAFIPDTERNGKTFDYYEQLKDNPNNYEIDIIEKATHDDLLNREPLKDQSESPTGYVADSNGKVNTSQRNSTEDSDGNALTAEQQRFFKDSKIRDDDGKLRVMYHGTEKAGFTIFNSDYGTSAKAMFFTTSRDVAKTYSATKDEYTPTNFKTAKQVQDAIQAEMGGVEEYTVTKENGRYVPYDDGEFADSFENLNDVFKQLREADRFKCCGRF